MLALASMFGLSSLQPVEARAVYFVGSSGFNVMTCEDAAKFRDGPLFTQAESMFKQYDQNKEQRIAVTLAAFEKDVALLEAQKKNALKVGGLKMATALGGLLVGAAIRNAESWVNISSLSVAEGAALKELAGRQAEWSTFFINYALDDPSRPNPDVAGQTAMPASLFLSITAIGDLAGGAWLYSKAILDIGIAASDTWIEYQGTELTAENARKAARKILDKSGKTKLVELYRLKDNIDKQCGHR